MCLYVDNCETVKYATGEEARWQMWTTTSRSVFLVKTCFSELCNCTQRMLPFTVCTKDELPGAKQFITHFTLCVCAQKAFTTVGRFLKKLKGFMS